MIKHPVKGTQILIACLSITSIKRKQAIHALYALSGEKSFAIVECMIVSI